MILRSQMQQFCWRQRPAASSPHEPSRARCAAWRFWIGLVSPGACAADDAGDWFPALGRTGTECRSTCGISQGVALAILAIALLRPSPGVAQSVALAPSTMPGIGSVSERYQSYNVEMIEVTGGR